MTLVDILAYFWMLGMGLVLILIIAGVVEFLLDK
jgi:hypothetical protein